MTSCAVHYDVIYHPFPINSQYLETWEGGGWGVDSPVHVLPIYSSTRCPFIWINLINDVKVKMGAPKAARRQNLHKRMKTCALTAVHTS